MSAERLRAKLEWAAKPWTADTLPTEWREVRDAKRWIEESAPDAIALLADMGEALESIRTARGNKGGSARNEALTNNLLARLDALCGDER